MTVPVGGERERFIIDSVHTHLYSCLAVRGWFTADPNRKTVHYITKPFREDEKIEMNTIAVFTDRVAPQVDLELGSLLGENHWQWYADVYAEDEAVGVSLSGDIRDILRGRIPSAGADRPVIPVLNFELPSPPTLFEVEIENVSRDRPPTYSHPWQQFWFIVPFTVVDSYDGEGG